MRLSWKAIVAGTAASVGALVLGATALIPGASAQAPSPPARFFGTATLNGQPAANNTEVVARIGSQVCGSGRVVTAGGASSYVVDVASANTQAGCGTNGANVTFTVGGVAATQTGMWMNGAFIQLNLTAQAPTPTPAPPTPTATPVRTATPAPPPPPPPPPPPVATTVRPTTVVPATTVRPLTPTVRPPQQPSGPAAQPAKPGAQAPAAPAAARPATGAAPAAQAAARPAAAPAALPRTGTGFQADNSMAGGWVLGSLALAVLALGATGLAAYRRSR